MRKHVRSGLLAAFASLAVSGAAFAADDHGLVETPDAASVTYGPGPANLPKGTQLAVLSGDPSKPGPFALRIKFPANTLIAPHTHSKPETLTILGGAIFHEHGKTVDKTKGKELRVGGFVYLPELMPHSLWTTDQPVELQVNGSGPFGVDYIDPADDPSESR
ncbi:MULTISPECIES: cupin domain-containing protein [Methylobacterium]|uniref:Cupin n=1 Tax=Methylobacterium thuringiense TaxID=1003091 RepID=A0ABQ4TGZ7_9HYPH|nr:MULTISPECIES: cupin domain-containing protein [Methylobacterium]TXN25123.1 cupin [Methylobacterium sp. WL9]GJE54674.1 hypothetical protein EKPJFOCH_1153 [Methylobacterium thuringiense]